MRSSWSLLAVAATLALPALAHAAPDPFAQFKRACVDGKAKPAAIAAAVSTAEGGWRQVDRATWSRQAADGEYRLVSGVEQLEVGERRTCTLIGPANLSVDAQARAWAGQRPSAHHGDTTTYLLIDAARKPRTPSAEEASNWRNADRISGLAVSTAADTTTLSYASFTAKTVPPYREPFTPPPELNFSYAARVLHAPDSPR
ncbi:hypothetical protein [Caulobacter sp. RHG1]|uniref:hypothetical protein n=1 Tax=Caulobacter sp. (strain RHG1) TaxID=2545762 RepID=UPI001554AFBE|nr:hypothetical protein [Caulobacter sp. RHG1]NQE64700.1 hypothetical protein [Caulobacter sp. RHG1]